MVNRVHEEERKKGGSLKPVGIIANPASGKDIRRLVAYGSVFDNNEKVNIVKRLLLAMDSLGVGEALVMPDDYCIGKRAADSLEIGLRVRTLEMHVEGNADDTSRAAELLCAAGAACIVTLGGDGTNRAAAKTCGDVPLLPISTGTNNVFPCMVEGTLAGLAAGVLALEAVPTADVARRSPRLAIYRREQLVDIALIDVVISRPGFVGARAIWDVSTLYEIFLTRAAPGNIGFSAVGGYLCPLTPGDGKGLHIVIGKGGKRLKAPIAPGLICTLPIASHRLFGPGESLPVARTPAMLALDGERESNVRQGDELVVRLELSGPLVIDIDGVLREAGRRGLFLSDQA
jgi:predicted polyphosphate/ATP-dependent NAD kinase